MSIASTAGQSFADGEWRRKCAHNGIVIVGPAALLADDPGSPQGGKPSGWRAQRARSKGGKGERSLTFGSGHGGSLVTKGQGKGGKKGGTGDKGSYKGNRADLGGGDSGAMPVYKPARSGPWVRCQCPSCPGFGQRPSFKYISQMQPGGVCLGCGTEWDFSLAMAVQQGAVPHFFVAREGGAQAGPFA